jgi:hypothetical protein
VQRLGLEMLGLAVLVAGGFQIAAGLLKLGQWFRAVSPAVISGMLAGIGVLIFASQFHVMVDDKPRKSGLENLLSIPEAVWKGVGIPHVAEIEEREFRSASLKTIADLAHQQVNLRTHVGERIPFHQDVHDTPELKSVVVDELAELAPDQDKITKSLDELDDQLDVVTEHVGDSRHLQRAHDALEEARQKSEIAAAALRDGRAVDAVETQVAAASAIELTSTRLKNHRLAAGLGLLTIAVIIAWQKLAPK